MSFLILNDTLCFPPLFESAQKILYRSIRIAKTSGFVILFVFLSGCLFCRLYSFVILPRLFLAIVLINFSRDGSYFRSFPDDLGLLRLEGVVDLDIVFEL